MCNAASTDHAVSNSVELAVGSEMVWLADDMLAKRKFALDELTAQVLVAIASGAHSISEISSSVPMDASPTTEDLVVRVDGLCKMGLVHPRSVESENEVNWIFRLRQKWRLHNWEAAARYHVATYDYPFYDYSRGGFAADRQHMASYRSAEPDSNRYKEYVGAPQRSLPKPTGSLLPIPATQLGMPVNTSSTVHPDPVSRVLSMTFGITGEISSRTKTSTPPALHRTSPSGGARHPSEAYFLNIDFEEFSPGIFHVMSRKPSLEYLGEVPGEEVLREMFRATWLRSPFKPRGIVVITCVFERNMYRYREPRTFRTIHLDAGHLASTLEFAARSLGLRTFVQYRDNEHIVEKELGLDFLEEGYMLAVALG